MVSESVSNGLETRLYIQKFMMSVRDERGSWKGRGGAVRKEGEDLDVGRREGRLRGK